MRRTPLQRRTPLRATRWGIGRSKKSKNSKNSNNGLGETRPLVLQRTRGMCEICGKPIRGDEWEDHHVFYRSHMNKQVRHELWNRSPLHDGCHRGAHNVPGVRALLEAKAVQRLYEHLGTERIPLVLQLLPEGATTPAAFVRAYEKYSRQAA